MEENKNIYGNVKKTLKNRALDLMISADFVVFKIDMNSHADIIRSKDPNQYNLGTGVMKTAHNFKLQLFALILYT